MNRQTAVESVTEEFDSGAFRDRLAREVGYRTESQNPDAHAQLRAYLDEEIRPWVERLGFTARLVPNPVSARHPMLIAHRIEGEHLPTVLTYGHGDVQPAHAQRWRTGLDPWRLTVEDGIWYGRGVADNKGQHTINLTALEQVLRARGGRLGYNVTLLLDMGEEVGSPGLADVCDDLRDELAADLLLASDGPRVAEERPTVFLGARGGVNFTLRLRAREGAHHSGNWGGLLSNPATILANAVASLVDGRGRLRVDALRPADIPEAVREALRDIDVGTGRDDPAIDANWGEPGLSPAERVFGWNTIEVLAMSSGEPDQPANAIPPTAAVHGQLRFVVGTDPEQVEKHLRAHLDAHGFESVQLEVGQWMSATRLDPSDPWVGWALESLRRTTGKTPALLPNLGGSLPNAPFADLLSLPTIWVPHSYPGCAQHAPDEHLPQTLIRESLQVMAGLFSDLADLDSWPPGDGSGDRSEVRGS